VHYAGDVLGGLILGKRKRPRRTMNKSGNSRRDSGIPDHWPFARRRIAGTAERELWFWLCEVFPDHHVLVKVPVARFLIPTDLGKAGGWMRVLSGVYCTFTVCTEDGYVIGCVDLVGAAGLPHGNRQIKQTLLSQCGVSYWAVGQGQRLNSESLRADFLGLNRDSLHPSETGVSEQPSFTKSQRIRHVRTRLHETLDRNRFVRDSTHGELENPLSDMAPASSLTPLQSHRAGLDPI
jgi:hypothetical protein